VRLAPCPSGGGRVRGSSRPTSSGAWTDAEPAPQRAARGKSGPSRLSAVSRVRPLLVYQVWRRRCHGHEGDAEPHRPVPGRGPGWQGRLLSVPVRRAGWRSAVRTALRAGPTSSWHSTPGGTATQRSQAARVRATE
jgi:hypothetical protein